MSRKESLAVIEDIFRSLLDDEDLTISENTELKDIEGFDSIMLISLIGSVESEFGRRFPLKEMVGITKVQQLVDLVIKE